MFLVFDDRHRTEPVPGGLVRHMTCPKCHLPATFREHVVSKQFRLYFVDMFTHDARRVMACDACGTMFVTDELAARPADNDHRGTVLGAVQSAARKGKAAAADVLGGDIGEAARTAKRRLGGLVKRLRGGPDSGR